MTPERANDWGEHHLLYITEADQPERAFALSNTMKIGRDNQNDIVIESITASRCHAVLLRDAAGVRLIDLESANGTLVNGVLARPDEPVRLSDGDMIRFGKQVARYSAPPSDGDDLSHHGSQRAIQRKHLIDPQRRRRLTATWVSTGQGLSARWEINDCAAAYVQSIRRY